MVVMMADLTVKKMADQKVVTMVDKKADKME